MKIYSNEKLIKRNGRIGNITSLLSIGILAVGMIFSFKDTDGKYLTLTFSCLIIGFLAFQVGNYYMSKFGKSPRPDQNITAALKGLDDKYTLYHYLTSVSHLLVGPSGIFCLLPFHQPGTITYDANKRRWKQAGGNFFLKTFGGESIGRPDQDILYSVQDIQKFLEKKGVKLESYTPEAVIVFTNEKATLNVESFEGAAVTGQKLKDYIRKKSKSGQISPELLASVQEIITPK